MKKLAEWASKHKVALSASIIAAVIAIALMTVFWGWLSDGESGSTTIRNVGLVIGGAIALAIAGWRSVVADRQSRAAKRQAETAQADLLNKRYQEGAAMLGNEVLSVRLAGIYALERLAQDHPEQYHIEIMKSLCAFVRHPTKDAGLDATAHVVARAPDGRETYQMRVDVQVALAAIGACHSRQLRLEREAAFRLELDGVDFSGARLPSLNLSNARLRHAFLTMGFPICWDLTDADLTGARLDHANFTGANLTGATMNRANVTGTHFSERIFFPEEFAEAVDHLPPDKRSARGLTQAQLNRTRAEPGDLPKVTGMVDPDTGYPLDPLPTETQGSPDPEPDEDSDA